MQLLLAIGLARMMQRVNFDQVIAGVSRFRGVFHVRTLFLMYQTTIVSHGFLLSDRIFYSILLFAHVQLNAVVAGMTYVLSCKPDYRNSKGEPTRFSLFHFQQNGCSSGGMTLESEGYDPHFVAVCKHRNYQADDEHPQFHELVLNEESQVMSFCLVFSRN